MIFIVPSKEKSGSQTIQKIERVPTGIPGLDDKIEGGFVKNSTVMVRGGSGTVKTILCLQYLYAGVTQYDEPGVYISFAESRESIYQHGNLMGWDFEELEKKKKFTIIRYEPHEIVNIMEEGGGSIRDTIESLGAKRLVVDSLSAYEMVFENQYKANESMLDLFELLRKWGATTLVTSEFPVSPKKQVLERSGFLTDSIINLYYLRVNASRVRALEIIKMRDTLHSDKIYRFILNKSGLHILKELKSVGKL